MVASIRRMTAGDGYKYLLKTVVAGDGDRSLSTPLTRYYAETGTPPGRWMGSGVRDLALQEGDEVTERHLELLIGHGRHPVTGAQLGRAYPAYDKDSKRKAVAGFDFTFFIPKSASVLWALADAGTQAIIADAHHAAVKEMVDFMEREIAVSRSGAGTSKVVGVLVEEHASVCAPRRARNGVCFRSVRCIVRVVLQQVDRLLIGTECASLNAAPDEEALDDRLPVIVLEDFKHSIGQSIDLSLLRWCHFKIHKPFGGPQRVGGKSACDLLREETPLGGPFLDDKFRVRNVSSEAVEGRSTNARRVVRLVGDWAPGSKTGSGAQVVYASPNPSKVEGPDGAPYGAGPSEKVDADPVDIRVVLLTESRKPNCGS